MSKISNISKLIREIGEFQIGQKKIEQELARKIKEAKKKIARKQEAINRRAKLMREKGNFPDGEVMFYTSPWALSVKDDKNIIELFERRGLDDFVGEKVEKKLKRPPIKKAILKESDSLAGIEGLGLTRRKEIRITPKTTGITVIRTIKTIKKFLS